MSLGVVIKGPEGVVLAADSRITLTAQRPDVPPMIVTFDNATKLLTFNAPNTYVAAVTYGAALVGLRTAHSFVPEFELTLENQRLSVEDFARKLSQFFMERWQEAYPQGYTGPNMTFVVGGFDDGAAYGRVFLFQIPRQPDPQPRNPGEQEFGITWGGQLEVASRLIHGFDPAVPGIVQRVLGATNEQMEALSTELRTNLEFRIPYDVLPLQDCVDLATFLIRTTIAAQSLAIGVRGVGGMIEVAVITRTRGLEFVQQKHIRGEVQ